VLPSPSGQTKAACRELRDDRGVTVLMSWGPWCRSTSLPGARLLPRCHPEIRARAGSCPPARGLGRSCCLLEAGGFPRGDRGHAEGSAAKVWAPQRAPSLAPCPAGGWPWGRAAGLPWGRAAGLAVGQSCGAAVGQSCGTHVGSGQAQPRAQSSPRRSPLLGQEEPRLELRTKHGGRWGAPRSQL